MSRLAIALLVLAVPLTAAADDESPPGEETPVEDPPPIEEPVAADSWDAGDPSAAPGNVEAQAEVSSEAPAHGGCDRWRSRWHRPAVAAPAAAPDPCASVTENPCASESPCGGWKGRRMKGRLAIGFSKGHFERADDSEAKQKSFLARVSGRRGWELEFELSKLTLDGDNQRTSGLSLVKSFGRRKLRPYAIAGIGGGEIQRATGAEDRLGYAEFGGGLMLKKRRFAIGADIRRGVRHVEPDDAAPMAGTTRMAETPTAEDHERYVRGRILALFYF